MSLQVQAVVNDVVLEMNAQGTGPYTVFNVPGITSGQIYDKLTEANAALQGWTNAGATPTASISALAKEQVKRFEVAYACARLGADLIGIEITDGFNYNLGGLAVQRAGAQMQAYTAFIKDHLDIAKEYIKMLHPWFWVMNPDVPQGWTENNTPVTTWSVSSPRYG